MDHLPVFAHPQLLAAALALVLLGLALSLEGAVLVLSLRAARAPQALPMASDSVEQDFYDWIYE